jgi:hypothetical protein
VAAWSPGSGNIIAYNAIFPSPGTPALRPEQPGGTITGNTTCLSPVDCFVNGTNAPYDLWPAPAGPLHDAAGSGPEAWRPTDDFMGAPRGDAADVGAYERTSGSHDHFVGGGQARPPRVSSCGGAPVYAAPKRAKAAHACEAPRDRTSQGSGPLGPGTVAGGTEQHPCLAQTAPRGLGR